ncbi:MAG: DVU_1556 family methyltransferase [Solirubrobacterales bacterium]
MEKSKCSNLYENKILRDSLGETLRPGGFKLTERALGFTSLEIGDTVLDIGSGMGDTVNYLKLKGLNSIGIEPSDILIEDSLRKYPENHILKGTGEQLPTSDNCAKAVFAECTISLMDDLDKTLKECARVLKSNGYLIITDVYSRKPENLWQLDNIKLKSCLRSMINLESLMKQLDENGFSIILNEDHTECLKQLTVNLIFKYGSMGIFWNKISCCGENAEELKNVLANCKPGYFLIICKKN